MRTSVRELVVGVRFPVSRIHLSSCRSIRKKCFYFTALMTFFSDQSCWKRVSIDTRLLRMRTFRTFFSYIDTSRVLADRFLSRCFLELTKECRYIWANNKVLWTNCGKRYVPCQSIWVGGSYWPPSPQIKSALPPPTLPLHYVASYFGKKSVSPAAAVVPAAASLLQKEGRTSRKNRKRYFLLETAGARLTYCTAIEVIQ